ncbi:MAG TPA: class E sortase [Actinomycetota bacterium]
MPDEGERVPGLDDRSRTASPEARPDPTIPAGSVEAGGAASLEERLRDLSERASATAGGDPVAGLLRALEEALTRIERDGPPGAGAPPTTLPATGPNPSAPAAPTIPAPTIPDRPAGAPTPTPAPPGSRAERVRAPRGARAHRLAVAGRITTVFGVLVVLLLANEFWLTGLVEARSQNVLLTQFRGAMTSGLAYAQVAAPPPGAPVALLEIPVLHEQQVVVEGSTPVVLKQGPGHERNTPLPGLAGNSVILGHRTTYGGPFRHLDSLQPGDRIVVTMGLGQFSYLVQRTVVLAPESVVVYSTTHPGNYLTLVTSAPAYRATARLVVVARLVGPPAGTPPPPPGANRVLSVDARELGLAGDGGGFGPMLLWGELLLAAGFVAWRLWRKGSHRRATYLLTVPVIVALLVLFFETFDRLLPGTY